MSDLALQQMKRDFPDVGDMLPLQDAEPSLAFEFVTGTGVSTNDLQLKMRAIFNKFSFNNPGAIRLVVNNPMNRQHHAPSRRGSWEVLVFGRNGLQSSKDVVLSGRHTVQSAVEAVLKDALTDWIVSAA